jgi:hypothetical protein
VVVVRNKEDVVDVQVDKVAVVEAKEDHHVLIVHSEIKLKTHVLTVQIKIFVQVLMLMLVVQA